jgi:choline dehydrogenase
VRIRSADPRVYPALRFNYLSTERDRREWVESVRTARHIMGQPAFEPYNDVEILKDTEVSRHLAVFVR